MERQSFSEIIQRPCSNASVETFSQYTVGRMIHLLLDLVRERAFRGRLLHFWQKSAFPMLPESPHPGQFPKLELHRAENSDHGWLCLALQCGEQHFAMLGRLIDTPGASVFQQRLPIELYWGFSKELHDCLLDTLEISPALLEDEDAFAQLPAEFSSSFIKYLESNLLESRYSLNLITGILEVQKAISSELDFDRLLELTGDIMRETFGFAFGELELVEDDGQLHHKKSWSGQGLVKGPAEMRILLDEKEQQELFKARGPVFLADVMRNPLILNQSLIRVLGLRNAIFLPLYTADQGVGLLKLFYSHHLHLSGERLGWLEELATLLANAILNAREHTRVFELATKDGLTNIHNRRYFEEQYDLEVQRLKRHGGGLCLLMLDVDHFKNYNDNNGHLAGDQVLIRVAKLIKSTVRSVDFLARYGGEEFIILLSGASLVQGWRVAEKIRTRIANEPFENSHTQPTGSLTVSIGAAVYGDHIQRMEDLIKQADQALYYAKDHGRNQVAIYENPTGPTGPLEGNDSKS